MPFPLYLTYLTKVSHSGLMKNLSSYQLWNTSTRKLGSSGTASLFYPEPCFCCLGIFTALVTAAVLTWSDPPSSDKMRRVLRELLWSLPATNNHHLSNALLALECVPFLSHFSLVPLTSGTFSWQRFTYKIFWNCKAPVTSPASISIKCARRLCGRSPSHLLEQPLSQTTGVS